MSISAYTSATQVAAIIQLTVEGAHVDAQSVAYRVIDSNDVELVPRTSLASFVVSDTEVNITVSAIVNTINSPTETREMRVIELYVNNGVGEIRIEHYYVVEKVNLLAEGINSFQGYGKSLMTALTIQRIPWWDAATKEARSNAMIEARRAIGSLPLRHHLNDTNAAYIDNNIAFRDITLLTSSQYLGLPQDFKDALCRAQVLQANYLLADDENEAMRESGVIAVTVGEAKRMFAATKAYKPLVNKRSLVELSRWLISGVRTGR